MPGISKKKEKLLLIMLQQQIEIKKRKSRKNGANWPKNVRVWYHTSTGSWTLDLNALGGVGSVFLLASVC